MLREKTLAVLGAGMMGGALARGLVRAGAMPAAHIALYDAVPAAAARLAADLGPEARVAASAPEAAAGADILLLAVKPHIIVPLLESLSPTLLPTQLVLSIAAGVPLAKMESSDAGRHPRHPRHAEHAGAGRPGRDGPQPGPPRDRRTSGTGPQPLRAVGEVVVVEERLMDAVTGLSGSGPAYVYLIIEALADGGVKAGLPRDTARRLAAQTVLGAAQMVLTSGEHPAQLKDNVTTPGGTTIAALAVLERAGVRSALIDAVEASANRSKELSGG